MIRASAIVPAAGRGERFRQSSAPSGGSGRPTGVRSAVLRPSGPEVHAPTKMLADIGGEPMLSRTIRCLLDGGVAEVIVVLAPRMEGAMTTVVLMADARVRVVINPDPSRGMFSSIQAGVAATTGDPILILPGDMPFVRPETVATLLAAYQRDPRVISPSCEGRRGHPLVLPAHLREAIAGADPAGDLSSVLSPYKHERLVVNVSDRGILRDVDVVADME